MCAAIFIQCCESSIVLLSLTRRSCIRDSHVVLVVGLKRWPFRAEPQATMDVAGLPSVSTPAEKERERMLKLTGMAVSFQIGQGNYSKLYFSAGSYGNKIFVTVLQIYLQIKCSVNRAVSHSQRH